MKEAREMLVYGKSVLKPAGKVGYKHAAHFTCVFRKHQDYQPGKLEQ